MAASIVGPARWSMTRKDDGHRTYKLVNKVRVSDIGVANSLGDGPFVVLNTPGLPLVGSFWSYGNDVDVDAYCSPEISIKPHPQYRDEKVTYWEVENTFTTIPNRRCQDDQFTDPLSEPQKISGTFLRTSQESFRDKDGNIVKSSSHELFRGANVEFDVMMPSVHIEQNVSDLELALVSQLISPRPSLNDGVMWGLPARCIKFANFTWEQIFFGTCDYFYRRYFDFEVNYGTWDRTLDDKGTKVLHGEFTEDGTAWEVKNLPDGTTPDPDNPDHFIRFKDRSGENSETLLNGAGLPYNPNGVGAVAILGEVEFQYYPSADLFQLNVPAVLGPPS